MRNYYIICYDVTCNKRLNKIRKILKDFGNSAQYSVFECVLTKKDLIVLKFRIKKVINRKEDKFYIFKIGAFKKDILKNIERIGIKKEINFDKTVII